MDTGDLKADRLAEEPTAAALVLTPGLCMSAATPRRNQAFATGPASQGYVPEWGFLAWLALDNEENSMFRNSSWKQFSLFFLHNKNKASQRQDADTRQHANTGLGSSHSEMPALMSL